MFNGFKFLLIYAWRVDKKYVMFMFIEQITSALSTLLIVILPKIVIDNLQYGYSRQLILKVAVFIFLIFLNKVLTSYFRNEAFILQVKIFKAFQLELGKKMTAVDLCYLENPEFQNLHEQADKFLYGNGRGFGFVMSQSMNMLGKLFVLLGVIGIIITMNTWIIFIFLVLILLNSVFQMNTKKQYAALEIEKTPIERETFYHSKILNTPLFGKEIRQNTCTDFILNKLDGTLTKSNHFYKKQMRLIEKSEIIASCYDIIQLAISYGYLIYAILKKVISLGDFMMYVNGIATFSSAMNDLLENMNTLRQFGFYYEAVEKYLNLPIVIQSEDKDNVPFPKTWHTLEFQHVWFRYPGQKTYIFEDLNLKIRSGEKLSIVGENGSGKTTLTKLMCRLYDPIKGSILLDGVDIKRYAYSEYAKLFSYVFQDFQLFSFSIAENIALSEAIEEKRMRDIFAQLNLKEAIDKLPKDIHQSIHKDFDENGFEPSGGQAQKLAIARALYKNAPVVVLDEPTAALDPKAEYDIYKNFLSLTKGKTAIYISHRMSSTRLTDKIIVLQKGKIVEEGTHEALMQKDGIYKDMFNLQANQYENLNFERR